MTFLSTFLDVNRDIILFVYGLVFFVLGLAIALHSRRYSRLDLARSLKWLAAFGLTHGFHEWGDVFIPIQATYLSEPAIQFLNVLQLVLLAISFAFLFEFGMALLRPFGRVPWLHGVSVGLLLAWVFGSFFVLLPIAPDTQTWHHSANALARYFIGFPGALLAAYGLRQQAMHRIAPLNVPHIVSTLRIAGVALFLYALLGGLIPPPVSFFPGNLLNDEVFWQVVGLPPFLFRSLVGLALAVAIFRALEIFDLETERIIEAMEQQQILTAERERIARELHDGAIQTVYTAGLLVESASRLAEPDSQLATRLNKAVSVLNDAIRDLRRNLDELRSDSSGEPLQDALRRLAEDPRFHTLVDVSLDLDLPDAESFLTRRTDHILAIVAEALSNIVRHARAQRVKIHAHCLEGRLILTIQDDGVGLRGKPQAGYGLRNMHDRARLLGGRLDIHSATGRGTVVRLDVPIYEER